jgi:hypothetical protein
MHEGNGGPNGPGAAADLAVGEDGAADGEPAWTPTLADAGPLVEHSGHRRRHLWRCRRGRAAGGEAAEGVQLLNAPHTQQRAEELLLSEWAPS